MDDYALIKGKEIGCRIVKYSIAFGKNFYYYPNEKQKDMS